MDCAAVDELLAAYSLGSVTPEEAHEIEEHLAGCDRHPLLAEFREIAAMLPSSVPPITPRDQVKHRLMARVYTDLSPSPVRRLWWQRTWSLLAAAALAVVAIGLGVRDWVVSNQLAGAPVTFSLAPVTSGASTTGTLVFLPRQNTATLLLKKLPPLPAGRVYEVWLIKAGTPEPDVVFRPAADGSASVVLKGSPAGFATVAVTNEPGPRGGPTPTSAPFVSGSLSAGSR